VLTRVLVLDLSALSLLTNAFWASAKLEALQLLLLLLIVEVASNPFEEYNVTTIELPIYNWVLSDLSTSANRIAKNDLIYP
jgi:hypothetical protein